MYIHSIIQTNKTSNATNNKVPTKQNKTTHKLWIKRSIQQRATHQQQQKQKTQTHNNNNDNTQKKEKHTHT